jgi:tRNA pseudouridine55 synthase
MTPISEQTDFLKGVVIPFHKEYGWTSFDLVKKVRTVLKAKFGYQKIRVGHAGTLDPLATGLLLICTGAATKTIQSLQLLEKEYFAEIHLGAITPSYDLETSISQTFPYEHIHKELVGDTLTRFTGAIQQVPPDFSAKWSNGKRAYKLARTGSALNLKPVSVYIHAIELISFELPDIIIRIVCSKGTYIRSLARDLGTALHSGAYLKNLTRTRIGDYLLGQSLTLEKFKEKIKYL